MPLSCPRPRHTAAAALLAAAAAATATVTVTFAMPGPPAEAGAAAPSAQAEYQAVLNAVGSEGVHFLSSATQGKVSIQVEGDTGASSGQQQLVVHNGSVAERMSALVVGATGYVNGNVDGLHNVIGLTSSQSSKYAGQWLSFPTSNSGLDQLVNGLLDSQVRGELQMTGPYSYGTPTTVDGQRSIAIQGKQATQSGGSVPTVLDVAASGKPLPLKEITDPGNAGGSSAIHGTVTFSKWGEHVAQHAPAHSVSLLKLVPASSGATSS